MDRTGQAPGVVSVTELQRAWQAVRGGQFRRAAGETTRPAPRAGAPGRTSDVPGARWWSDAPLLPVVGCHGGAGASTLAAAVADRVLLLADGQVAGDLVDPDADAVLEAVRALGRL